MTHPIKPVMQVVPDDKLMVTLIQNAWLRDANDPDPDKRPIVIKPQVTMGETIVMDSVMGAILGAQE